ncbi:MAG: HAMP domain-containing histidine kinase [Peptococcaceae bacterium]|nr:HAMP domain-containing histidine kinase [Peptococcaceae bacterium]
MEKQLLIGIWIGVGVMCLLLVAVFRYYQRTRRQTLEISAMLDRAMLGRFQEGHYDESQLSLLETKMYQYLVSCRREQESLAAERDAIKTLISDISHQTKTPIANLRLYGQLLQEQSKHFSPEAMLLLQELLRQTEKLDFLIQSLIKLSRLEAGIIQLVPEENSIKLLLQEVMDNISGLAALKNIKITAHLLDLSGVFDWKWTAEALGNILDNSVKYTPEGGAITINMEEYPSFVRINMTDTGIGIAEEEIPKIFGRFYRSPGVKQEEGCGIGLYLARTIIHQQYGYIKVHSVVGEGSTFSVLLKKDFFTGGVAPSGNDEAVFREAERNKGNQ